MRVSTKNTSKPLLPPDLIHLTDEKPGITRRKYGRGFAYYHPSTGHISAKKELERIRSLVIPPAWENVWIAPIHNSHLQATGRDGRKRKQYRYHQSWLKFSTTEKYNRLVDFGEALPTIRKRYTADLQREKWDLEKTAALAVAVMDSLHLRVGNNYYSQRNHTYGLTTLRRKHLNLKEDALELSFVGKTGKERQLNLENKKLIRLVKECSDLPGYEIFRYKANGSFKPLKSEDFNSYLRDIAGDESVSAKDFRTWGANVLCLEKAEEAKRIAEHSRKKTDTILVKMIAKEMGHTVSTCKSSYLHPDVLTYALSHSLPCWEGTSEKEVTQDVESLLITILKKVSTEERLDIK